MSRAAAILLNEQGNVEQISVDTSPRSPFTHDALGGTPTIQGAWNGVVLLGRAEPSEGARDVDETLLRPDQRESGPLKVPLLLTRADGADILDFTTEDYEEWLAGN